MHSQTVQVCLWVNSVTSAGEKMLPKWCCIFPFYHWGRATREKMEMLRFGMMHFGYIAFFLVQSIHPSLWAVTPGLSPCTGGTSSALCNWFVMWFVASAWGMCTGDGAVALVVVTWFPLWLFPSYLSSACSCLELIHPLLSHTVLLLYCRLEEKQQWSDFLMGLWKTLA